MSLKLHQVFKQKTHILCLGTVFAITSLLYFHGLHGPFMFDDHVTLPQALILNFNLGQFLSMMFNNSSGILGRPVAHISFMLNSVLLGTTSLSFKFANLLLHILTGFILYKISLEFAKFHYVLSKARWLAILASSLWLVHPIQVSTVLYAVQRMAILSSLFTGISILFYIKLREILALNSPNYKSILYFSIIILSFLLGVLSKENALLLPIYLICIECFIFQSKLKDLLQNKAILMLQTILIVIPITLGTLYILTHFSNFLSHYQFRDFTLTTRLLTQIHVLWFYLKLILWPTLHSFGLYHDDFKLVTTLGINTIFGLLGFLLSIFFAIKFRKIRPISCFGILLFFSAHLMESSIFALEIIFEHRNYLALFGIMLVIADITMFASNKCRNLKLPVILIMLLFSVLSLCTLLRADAWSSQIKLYTTNILHHPNSARANLDWVNFLIQHQKYDEAYEKLQELSKLHPSDPGFMIHALNYNCAKNIRPTTANLLTIQTLLETTNSIFYSNNALLVIAESIINNSCASINATQIKSLFEHALLNPKIQAHHKVAQQLYHVLGKLEFYLGMYHESFLHFDKAYKLYPKNNKALYQKAVQYLLLKNTARTQETLQQIQATLPFYIKNNEPIFNVLKQELDLIKGKSNE